MRTFHSGFVAIAIAAGLLAAPNSGVAGVTISGDSFTNMGDPPCCATTLNLFVGTKSAPVSGSLVVDDGSSLNLYHTMSFGIFNQTARGDMVVEDNSSVDVGADLGIGHSGNASLVISGGSMVHVLAGPIPFAVSSFFGRPGCFSVGTFGGSNGSAVVTDPGSELLSDQCIVIGGGGVDSGIGNAGLPGKGSLDIVNGASVTTLFFNAGLRLTGIGTVTLVDGTLNILGTDFEDFGSFMTVARSARGVMTANGSDILIDPQAVIPDFDHGAGFNVNREETGDGELNLLNGSTLLVKGAFGFGGIGRRGGNSEVNIRSGSALIIEDQSDGAIWVSPEPGSTAKINVQGVGSVLDAGSLLSLGLDFNGDPLGGSCTVFVGKGGTIRAVTIRVGPDCKIKGNGTIEGNVIVSPGAKISKKITIIP